VTQKKIKGLTSTCKAQGDVGSVKVCRSEESGETKKLSREETKSYAKVEEDLEKTRGKRDRRGQSSVDTWRATTPSLGGSRPK